MTKETILLVDDEHNIVDLARMYLEQEGFKVEAAYDGQVALDKCKSLQPALVVLDLMLPVVDGWEICRRVRSTSDVPIIMLTARDDDVDKIVGLELGADDYVTKPFSTKELAARVGALLRRVQRSASPDRPLRHGAIEIDVDRHVVTVGGREVKLTAKEFLLLQYFLERPGRVLSRDLLLTDVWGYQYPGGTRTVDVHIRRLREKIPALGAAIETVKQFGYKLIDG